MSSLDLTQHYNKAQEFGRSDFKIENTVVYGLDKSIIASGNPMRTEIINNDWLVAEATHELLFKTPDEYKWQRAIDEFDFNVNDICLRTGRA